MPTQDADAATELEQPEAARVIQSVPTTSAAEMRGTILAVLRALLSERRDEEIVALFTKLVARNGELEKKLGEMLSRRNLGGRVKTGQSWTGQNRPVA